MGFLRCALPFRKHEEGHAKSSHPHSESSNFALSSQSSLPSVPSLSSPPQHLRQPATAQNQCIATLKSHSYHVSSLALSEKYLYSGSSDGEIRAWSQDPSAMLDTGVDNLVAEGRSSIKSLVVFGEKLFSAHQDHKIRVWKIEHNLPWKYRCIATLPTLHDRFSRLFRAKNYVEVRRHKKCTWVHHVDAVSALALSGDGSLLYSASWDRTFKIWRTSDFRCLESVGKAHDDAINAILVSSDGFVYTGSADKKIKMWRKHEGSKKHSLVSSLEKHRSAVNALAGSGDGLVLYSGACDRSILVWERDNSGGSQHMLLAGALRGHTQAILCLAVVADLLVCSGSADKTVRIWRREPDVTYSCLALLGGHSRPVKCLTATLDSNNHDSDPNSGNSYVLYSGSLDYSIKAWRVWVPLL